MLGDADQQFLDADGWESIELRAETPRDLEGYFTRSGPTKPSLNEARGYCRFYFRQRAVLTVQGKAYAGYTMDISRSGFAAVSPIQLFPCDLIQVVLADGRVLQGEVVRCLRLDKSCYSCGATILQTG